MSEYFITREQAETDLLAVAAYIGERIKSADGRAEAMDAIVGGYLDKGDVDLAAEFSNTVVDPFSRDKLLTHVAVKCAELDDDEYAVQLADAVEDVGLRAEAFERIGLVKAASGDIASARTVAEQMSHPDFVEAAIACRLATDGDETAAIEAVDKIEFASARVQALQQIARKLIDDKADERAVEMLDRADVSAAEIEHVEEKIRLMCDNGNLFITARRNDRAIETFAAGRDVAAEIDSSHRDYFLGTCALGMLTAGSKDMAEATLGQVKDKTHLAATMLGFAREEWRKGDKEDAVETLEEGFEILEGQREIETRDSRSRNSLWTSIATQFAGFGKTERGIEIGAKNLDPDEAINAQTNIAQILIAQNEDALADEVVASIPEPAERAMALVGVSDELEKRGDPDAAQVRLDQVFASVDDIPQLASRVTVLIRAINRFANAGRLAEASLAVEKFLETITAIRHQSLRSSALAELSTVVTNFDDLSEKAKRTLNELVVESDV